MLVNSTIFGSIEETQVMAVALIDLMKGLKVQFCGVEDGDPIRDIGDEGPNCQWEEYQQTKEYLEKVKSTIIHWTRIDHVVYILHFRLMTSFKITCSNPQMMVQSLMLSWDSLKFSHSLIQE